MLYHQFVEELQSIECKVSIKNIGNVLVTNVLGPNRVIASFSVPDPNDFVEDAIIANVLTKVGMPNLIQLYQSM